MRKAFSTLLNVVVTTVLLASLFLVGLTASFGGGNEGGTSHYATKGVGDYDPWCDLDDDGDIDIYDIVDIAGRYGTSGFPFSAKAAIEYDSGWINTTDKVGQYFDVAHNLNNMDIMVDIQGKTTLDDGVHQRNLGGTDYTPEWSTKYGETGWDNAYKIVQTSDGGYAMAGSFGGDFWLIKTDSNGNMLWNKTYGGANPDQAYSAIQTSDDGYAIVGDTLGSIGSDDDIWLVRTDVAGNMIWNKTYGGADDDMGRSVVQISDGGYIIAGSTISFSSGDYYDFWLIKTDSNGNMLWNKTYGEANIPEGANSLIMTGDGGYAMAGAYNIYAGMEDVWLVKTDAFGNMEWNKTYGGIERDWANSLIQTIDGGYAIGCESDSFGAGSWDFWLVKTDESGNVQWNQTYGGPYWDYFQRVIQTSDGGYAMIGATIIMPFGDLWLVKTDAFGNMEWNKTYVGQDFGNYDGFFGSDMIQLSDGGYIMVANTWGAEGVVWLIRTETWQFGLVWTDSTADTITLYRGAADTHWNYVRVRVWRIKETP